MSEVEKRWFPVVRTLARDVDPAEYIYSSNHHPAERPRPRSRFMQALFRGGACILVGALLTVTAADRAGYRRLSPDDERALRVVHEVDPGHEVSTDEELARRWGLLAEAFRVVRTAAASAPTGEEYPYLARLAGTPSPAVSPGSGRAIVLLANALDLYSPAVQGKLIQRLLAIAASMDRWGVMEALGQLADLPPSVRERLFADQGAPFHHLADLAVATVDRGGIARQLEAELREAEIRRADLQRRLEEVIKATPEAEQTCTRQIRSAQYCLSRFTSSSPP